ncbi:hypothetical protein HPP92_013547 [Vanilla planifolia]|uniref:Patatin n=1 Tax=Vanilla planifolia TaxID=51239 RepID=A0A835QVT0_VANPL|nr:hypothetical protein HPP92_013547 [Vanilla planifolia]
MAASPSLMELSFDVDKMSYEIFNILESRFLFGCDDSKLFSSGSSPLATAMIPTIPTVSPGKVRILSIDAVSDCLVAAASLASLESLLRLRSGDPAARLSDYFDVVAGSGAGGVLAALLFARGPSGRSLFSAEDALCFLRKMGLNGNPTGRRKGLFGRLFPRVGCGAFGRVFGDATLRDTLKPLLIPCYDLSTGAPFLFSRADAVEAEAFDFRIGDICAATCAGGEAVKMSSVDGRTRIAALGGGITMANPAAAAITHVLHNKQEFPFTAGVEDLLVISIGGGNSDLAGGRASTSTADVVRIAGNVMADMVDQSIAMAFGKDRTSNYVRIQAKVAYTSIRDATNMRSMVEQMLANRNLDSVLFQGKKLSKETNAEKLDRMAGELIKEQESRKKSLIPTVVVKQTTTPRTSSATTVTTSASTGRSFGSP